MIKSINDFNFKGRKVLVRVDFNVPLNSKLEITDNKRIVASLPTIDKIVNDGGMPILMSHLGRPDGVKNPNYSLKSVAAYLRKRGYDVHFATECIGEEAQKTVAEAKFGEVVLLENLRFHKEEEKNDDNFANELAKLGDCYVNDAFGTAHRAHASTFQLAHKFQDRFCGSLLKSELDYLDSIVKTPRRPFVAVIGGAKISGKIDVINNLMDKCDDILIGGGMIFTFFKAMGLEIGKSILEADRLEMAKQILDTAKEKGINLHFPADVVVAKQFKNEAESRNIGRTQLEPDDIGLDIGKTSQKLYRSILESAETVLWNGPMGVYEMPNFAAGTMAIAKGMARATEKGATTIVGGGDSAAALKELGYEKKVSHVSTGGGASLEYLEGKTLPGIAALEI